jgi:hypothetical protein
MFIWKAKYYYLSSHYKIKIKIMATRSLIGINLDNGITKVIYCHWDGYPEHNGQLLVDNYTSPSAVFELMELGDLSNLDTTPAGCKAYHRDRKEPWGMVEPRDINTSELDAVSKDYGVDYVYTYNDEFEWECSRLDYASGKLAPLDILSNIALN